MDQGESIMTRTELIAKELLEAVDRPENLDAVFARHADSKGPFYKALAEATQRLQAHYKALVTKTRQEKEREEALQSSVGQLEKSLAKMQELERKMAKNIEKNQAVLDRLKELTGKGFGEAQLAKLVDVLAGWMTKSGLKPPEAVDRFLEAAGHFSDIRSLEQERARAERDKTVAEAEAKKAIAQNKLTTEAVKAAKWLASRRLSSETVLAWRAIADQLGLPTEGFPQGMADALKQYGTLEAACRAKAKERDDLTKQVEKLKAETATLQTEKQHIQAALEAVAKDGQGRVRTAEKTATSKIRSVKEEALTAIRSASEQFETAVKKADAQMTSTLQRFERLSREAAELERDVAFARALRTADPTPWLDVTAEHWDALLSRFLEWARAYRINNAEVPIPDEVKKAGRGSIEFPALHGQFRLPLCSIADWLRAGLNEAFASGPGPAPLYVLARAADQKFSGQKT